MSLSPRHDYWSAVVTQFHRSGLTQVDFCRTRHLSINSFRQWLYRLRHSRPAADDARCTSRSPRNQRRLDRRIPPSFPFTSDLSTSLPRALACHAGRAGDAGASPLASLTGSETAALRKAISPEFLLQEGWREGPQGQILNAKGRTVCDVGFANAIRKLIAT